MTNATRCGIPAIVTILLMAAAMSGPAFPESEDPQPILGYVNQPSPESAEHRALRHAIVAERRQEPVVLVHRGARAFAPENTLEAYAAAMDLGADGFEIDLRRTADGVLVTFHDPHLHRMLNGFGAINQLHYYEVLTLDFQPTYGTADRDTRVPTLVSALELARQRAALLFLDVKEPGIDEEIANLLDEADMWDHVVTVYGAVDHLVIRPELHQLAWKADHLYLTGRDWDPAAIEEDLAQPGEIIFVNDPRAATWVLGRPAWEPVPLPEGLRVSWEPSYAPVPPDPSQRTAMQVVRDLEDRIDTNSTADLLAVLRNADLDERFNPDGDEAYERARLHRLIERAWAARRLGALGHAAPEVATTLEEQILGRTLHRHWSYRGIDAEMAAYALALLGRKGSTPVLMGWHDSEHPELANMADASPPGDPLEWLDRGTRYAVLQAVGDLRTDASTEWLWQYLHTDPDPIHPPHIGGWQNATVAFLKHLPRYEQLLDLLTTDMGVVRAEAIMGCVDGRFPTARKALSETHPWALSLPRVEGRDRYR